MTRTIVGFGSYPIARPRHGGQRRVVAFRRFHASLGIDYQHAASYEQSVHGRDAVDPQDRPWKPIDPRLAGLPFVGDLEAGEFAAGFEPAFQAFQRFTAERRPVGLQLEHPFLWPLVKRLRQSPDFAGLPIIYSSHNVEAPLKRRLLEQSGVSRERAREVAARVAALEAEVVAAAALVVAVSRDDAAVYAGLGDPAKVVVARNGVDRVPAPSAPPIDLAGVGEHPYLLFVGSAYPPNIEGFAHFVLSERLFFLPPRKGFAICGGVSHGIFQHPLYAAQIGPYSRRVQFFPDPDDAALAYIKAHAHAFVLPIRMGGGSNLKTAEALLAGAWVVATPTALRSFEEFADAPGVLLADTPAAFHDAMVEAYHRPRLALDPAEAARREVLTWDGAFATSGLEGRLKRLLG
jgi:hypothetical protein